MNHYWIEPNGKIHHAPKGHIDFVFDHMSMFGVKPFEGKTPAEAEDWFDSQFDFVMKKGWVRVFNFQNLLEVTTERADKKLFDRLMVFLVNTRSELPRIEKVTVINLSPKIDQHTYFIGSVDKLVSGETSFNESLDESSSELARNLKKLYSKYIEEAHTIYDEAKAYEREHGTIPSGYTLLTPEQKKKTGSTYIQGGTAGAKFLNNKKKLHREDGPAYITTWGIYWSINDVLHRTDGPAAIENSGETFWVNGKLLSRVEFEKHFDIKESINERTRDLSLGSYREKFQEIYYNDITKVRMMYIDATDLSGTYGTKWLSSRHAISTGATTLRMTSVGTTFWFQNHKNRYHREDGPAAYDGDALLWMINGKLHRTDGPAVLGYDGTHEFYINGRKMKYEEYIKHFDIKESLNESVVFHARKISPIEQQLSDIQEPLPGGGMLYSDSRLVNIYTDKNGYLHRDHDLPAYEHKVNGKQIWYKHGVVHREGGKPAEVVRKNGKLRSESYYEHGLLHRINGPAFVNNVHDNKEWYQRGKLHRTDGPALVHRNRIEFYINGRPMTREEFEKHFEIKESDDKFKELLFSLSE